MSQVFVRYDRTEQIPVVTFGGANYQLSLENSVPNPPVTPLTPTSPFADWWEAAEEVETVTKGSTYSWTKLSGSGTVTFDDSTAEKPIVTVDAADEYVLRCTIDGGTTEDVTYWAMEEADLQTMRNYVVDPSTIPVNHSMHPPGPYAYGQVPIADLTSTALTIYQPPSLVGATEVPVGTTLQTAVNAATSGDVLHVRGARVEASAVNFGSKNLDIVCDENVEWNGIQWTGTGIVRVWNAKLDGYDSTTEQDPMVRLGDGSLLVHCTLQNAEWRNIAAATDLQSA